MNKRIIYFIAICIGVAFALFFLTKARHIESSKTQWIDPKQLQPGPIRTESLSDSQIQRIKHIQQVFAEVVSLPLESWIDDFKRDIDPDNEIQIWEAIANAYEKYCRSKELSIEAKKEVFGLLLMRSGAPEQEVLKNVKLKILTIEEAKEVLSVYTFNPAPIQVIKQ